MNTSVHGAFGSHQQPTGRPRTGEPTGMDPRDPCPRSMGAVMKIRCHTCDAENSVGDAAFGRQTRPTHCDRCGALLSAVSPAFSLDHGGRQEGSGLIDIRAMAKVLGNGAVTPGPVDEVAVASQPGLGVSLPTAGVIMPLTEPDRPWWLVPSLAVGGTLLVAVVALLAVLLIQPHGASRQGAGDSVVGAASVPAPTLASANSFEPAQPRARVPDRIVANIATKIVAKSTREVIRKAVAVAPAPAPEAERIARSPRQAHPRKRRPRRVRKTIVKPVLVPKVTAPREPRRRPRSIAEIIGSVVKTRPMAPKVAPRASVPAQLGRRSIQGALSKVMGGARACGRRFSTSGRVSLRLVVAGSTGRILRVSPKGAHASSLTGRCVARALRSARFKPFARSRQSFYYTVILR